MCVVHDTHFNLLSSGPAVSGHPINAKSSNSLNNFCEMEVEIDDKFMTFQIYSIYTCWEDKLCPRELMCPLCSESKILGDSVLDWSAQSSNPKTLVHEL